MPLTDLPYEDLLRYRPEPAAPADLDPFWDDTLAEARAHGGPASVTPVGDSLLRGAEVHDVRFPGYGGKPVAGWLLLPRGARGPLPVVAEYLGLHRRDAVEQVFAALAYVDGLHLAPRATAPALFSAALMDPVCPPSTVFATYHRYGGPAAIEVWRFGDHTGRRASQQRRQLEWLCEQGLGATN
ncbi:acetylxylan esterase [Kitasatospora sp. NPDC093679]|uniref:acetylxylan esterase n=1 Tax=Kitasatospora sp. NPDC093679 TaxID=3154983 RepID=UPI0034279FF5